ncbi:glycosyltransferase family 2 protein [Flavihumibacter petaseus]|uniref:Putative glycosyltransferase n=1 Tax=Flavihumibacter petaseus NBRC 106054 TaxID=1220578 RepID=A0A0E9N5F2_9BACT|nr:glycosyltransferase [Flavihumibacter petaseus]GAO45202.1 putative glycosyltransferase [Flavihumibacter petaseus NBRC 106054]
MNTRTPQTPPAILPRSEIKRPRWSVMIPAYNCIQYIQQTIESVLSQDLGVDQMQIEVVDDASTDGDLEQLVKNIGNGRVNYFRQPENKGSLRNFETCLQRATGEYVHLLHGDDLVMDGYYKEMEMLFEAHGHIGSAFCRNSFVDRNGTETGRTKLLLQNPGILPNWLEKISRAVYCQPPAVTVKRSVYEELGGFFGGHYGEDWEMWCRIAAHYPVGYSPVCLAKYRSHPRNISNKSHRTGQSLKDIQHFIKIIQNYLPARIRKTSRNAARENFSNHFAVIAFTNFYGDPFRYLVLSFKSMLMYPSKKSIYFFSRVTLRFLSGARKQADSTQQ